MPDNIPEKAAEDNFTKKFALNLNSNVHTNTITGIQAMRETTSIFNRVLALPIKQILNVPPIKVMSGLKTIANSFVTKKPSGIAVKLSIQNNIKANTIFKKIASRLLNRTVASIASSKQGLAYKTKNLLKI